jgi:transposase InsO family protein
LSYSWKIAVKNQNITKGLIFHSDQGVQYVSEKFANFLDSYNLIERGIAETMQWLKASSKP